MKPNIPPMNEEQKKEAMVRAFAQKRAALAEGILFNMVQGCGDTFSEDLGRAKYLVHVASEMANECMKVFYGQEVTFKEEE